MSVDWVLVVVGAAVLLALFGVQWLLETVPKIYEANARVNADVAFLQSLPSGLDEAELPYRSQSPLFDDDGWLR